MRGIGFYSHLDKTDPIRVEADGVSVGVSAEKLAEGAVKANYGVHRLLSCLVEERKKEDSRKKRAGREDRLMNAIEKLLAEGEF
jgi:hypothetical protein